jgi:ABC-type dipeptide/oligopeptide/nickel transport system permease component
VLSYSVRRLLGLMPTLVLVTALTFLVLRLTPGDPVAAILGDHAGDEGLAAQVRAIHGLDLSLWRQYAVYLGGLMRGDFGLSLRYPEIGVGELLARAALVTVPLAAVALALGLSAGVTLGLAAVRWHGTRAERTVSVLLLTGLSIPMMSLAMLLTGAVSVFVSGDGSGGLLPTAGWGTPRHAVLPVLVLAVPVAGHTGRLVRALLLDLRHRDYMRTARAKGLSETAILLRHGLPNLAGGLLAATTASLANLLGGTFAMEVVFAVPGMGRLAAEAVLSRDYPVITGVAVLMTLTVCLFNLAADLAAAVIDPRGDPRGDPRAAGGAAGGAGV